VGSTPTTCTKYQWRGVRVWLGRSLQKISHQFKSGLRLHGNLAEWSKALVLKTSGCQSPVRSNRTVSAVHDREGFVLFEGFLPPILKNLRGREETWKVNWLGIRVSWNDIRTRKGLGIVFSAFRAWKINPAGLGTRSKRDRRESASFRVSSLPLRYSLTFPRGLLSYSYMLLYPKAEDTDSKPVQCQPVPGQEYDE
jgi:hypothetical protein